MNTMMMRLIWAGLCLLITLPTQAGSYKCWKNEDGITECGNYVPPQYSQQGFKEFNEEGMRIKQWDRALTPEEIAAQKKKEEQEKQRKAQLAEDRALLDLFGSKDDIQRARMAVLNTIDGQIHSIETIITSLENNFKDLQDNLKQSMENPEVSENQIETIKNNIANVKQRIEDSKKTLTNKQEEKDKANKEYDDYLKRFRQIKRRGGLPPKTPEEEALEQEQAEAEESKSPAAAMQ